MIVMAGDYWTAASGGTSTLSVATTSGTAAGTYTITVTGTAASGTHTATYTVTVGSAAGPVTIEADAGGNTLGGDATPYSCPACSGGSRIGHLGKNAAGTGTLTYDGVTAAGGAGTYQIVFAYTNGSASARTGQISVDGGTAQTVSFPPTGAFTTPGTLTLALTLAA